MARYFASQGIGDISARAQPKRGYDDYPFIVIMGPSGQFGQIHAPSGGTVPANPKTFQAYEQTSNHKCLAFFKNEILYSMRWAIGTMGAMHGYAWLPYGSLPFKQNPASNFCVTGENGAVAAQHVVWDGFNHKLAFAEFSDWYKAQYSFLKIPGALFWLWPYRGTLVYGFYQGDHPYYKKVAATSGWVTKTYPQYARVYQVGADTLNTNLFDGMAETLSGGLGVDSTYQPCDIIYHKGCVYIAFTRKIVGIVPGTKGGYVHNNKIDDSAAATYVPGVAGFLATDEYTSRATTDLFGGEQGKCFAQHNGNLYVLQADGKVLEVMAAGVKQVADLTELGTAWASGIVGGAIYEANQTVWTNQGVRRPFIASFNRQLHAFLNFSTTHKVVKGTDGSATTGRGILWATSYDGKHWTDRSLSLPCSGIIPGSGTNTTWLNECYPYKISGFTGFNKRTYNKWQAIASGKALKFKRAMPSGFRQHKKIPFIVNSGTMVDAPGTAFGSLKCPLNRGAISGFLFPTWVQQPSSYRTVTGISGAKSYQPQGIGASGWNYTGCHNWHTSGYVDEQDSKLKLMFTEDYHGSASAAFTWGSTLIYELDQASGWRRVNYLAKSNQLNGFIPIDLYDPEVIIPSGDIYNPNPRINEVDQTVTVDYNVYDWPYWSKVTTRLEYSIDHGQTWNYAGGQRNINTGSPLTDPSGLLGGGRSTIVWKYTDQLSKNIDYPSVQLRIRAQED